MVRTSEIFCISEWSEKQWDVFLWENRICLEFVTFIGGIHVETAIPLCDEFIKQERGSRMGKSESQLVRY